jgi:hypothetical protein
MIAGEVIEEITNINFEKSILPLKALTLSLSSATQAIMTLNAITSNPFVGRILVLW